jgi:hypothetical protein
MVHYPDKKTFPIEGKKAPDLSRFVARWGTEKELFDGKSLAGWKVRSEKPKQPGWEAKDGELVCSHPGAENDLYTEKKFQDFKLHVEYRVAKGENSGVYLRGRYEMQVLGDAGEKPNEHSNASIYGRIAPSENPSRPFPEWNVADVELVGRTVTVVLNGKTVIDKKKIEGITGGAFPDPWEEETGPILLQGDHGKVAYRNLRITPGRK